MLLLEELHVSQSFRSWLSAQVFGVDVRYDRFLGAWHSVSHAGLGESDLIVRFADVNDDVVAILIENKIDAIPQPEQAARYRERARVGKDEGWWGEYRTCIVAPQRYLTATADVTGYDCRVSYESIQSFLQKDPNSDQRLVYRAKVLTEAIEQNRRGYIAEPHPGVTQFWSEYWKLADRDFPQLHMDAPGLTPARHSWARFGIPIGGSRRWILHKLDQGAVDLQLPSSGEPFEDVAAKYRHLLPEGIDVAQTGKSVSLRIQVREVDVFSDFAAQTEAVRGALIAATRLIKHVRLD